MKADYLLDASAVLAVMQGENGADKIEAMLPRAAISSVNLAEVATKLRRIGETETGVRNSIASLELPVVPFDEDLAHLAADLYPKTARAGLSLGDRACLATAKKLEMVAVTTDRSWKLPHLGVRVQVAR